MTSITTQKINPEEVYNKLVNLNGLNAFGLAMSYFDFLYAHKDFWHIRQPYGLSCKLFNSYVEFARYEVPWGLGWDLDIIKSHCKTNSHIWQEYEEQSNPSKTHGSRRHINECSNLHSNIDRGRQYQIQRLKRDAPDIAIKVINREISAKQGMEIAGLKDKTVVVKCKAEDFITKAINNLETNQIEKLVHDLSLYLNKIKP